VSSNRATSAEILHSPARRGRTGESSTKSDAEERSGVADSLQVRPRYCDVFERGAARAS
jgi:hypothetical protein